MDKDGVCTSRSNTNNRGFGTWASATIDKLEMQVEESEHINIVTFDSISVSK